ncbi:hypothetical protein [Actibacterium sp. 188UL27-1]
MAFFGGGLCERAANFDPQGWLGTDDLTGTPFVRFLGVVLP